MSSRASRVVRPRATAAIKSGALATLLSISATVAAAPWVETGDLRARHHLEALSSMGCFDGLTLSWPVNWSSVAEGVRGASDTCRTSEHAVYLRTALDRAKNETRTATVTLGGANEEPLFRHFAAQPAGRVDSSAAVSFTGRRFAARIEAGYTDTDGRENVSELRADGSFVAGRFGNWQLGAGAIDRWWGPGHHSSLAISTNARPVPGLWFGRQTAHAPRASWLSWVGPWNLQIFVGQLEQDRVISGAKLVGGRFTFRPASFLQIGFTRLFLWGDDERPRGVGSFGDAPAGEDNGQRSGFTDDDDPSNQIAGIDFRADFPMFGVPTGFYGQLMGEEEAGGLPSKFSALVGFDVLTGIGAGSQRFFLERTDTVAGRAFGDAHFNTAYQHGTYRGGFWYYGRSIASTFNGGARAMTLGGQQFFRNGIVFTASVTTATLNTEGGKRVRVVANGAEILQASAEQDIVLSELRLEHDLLGGRLSWVLAATDEAIDTFVGERERVIAMARWRHTFDW